MKLEAEGNFDRSVGTLGGNVSRRKARFHGKQSVTSPVVPEAFPCMDREPLAEKFGHERKNFELVVAGIPSSRADTDPAGGNSVLREYFTVNC